MTDSGALWVAALATGLRQGELLALRWDDVDVDTATLMSDPKRGHHRIARPMAPLAPTCDPATVRSKGASGAPLARARAREV